MLGEEQLDALRQGLELAPGLIGSQCHDRLIGDEAGIDARAFVKLLHEGDQLWRRIDAGDRRVGAM